MIQRPRLAGLFLAAALAACAGASEQAEIADFFAASRIRDLTALARFSTVVFEPREQGSVTTFNVSRVSAVRSEGAVAVKDVLIEAAVRGADGRAVAQSFVIRMVRRPRSEPGEAPALYGGWIITAVTPAAAPPL